MFVYLYILVIPLTSQSLQLNDYLNIHKVSYKLAHTFDNDIIVDIDEACE